MARRVSKKTEQTSAPIETEKTEEVPEMTDYTETFETATDETASFTFTYAGKTTKVEADVATVAELMRATADKASPKVRKPRASKVADEV